jgi:hypothetical protein
MIRKSDWQAIQEEMIAADRQELGEPPTAEEMLAYTRGELSPQQEARVRQLLVSYPELVHTLTASFPTDDDDSLSRDEVSKRWTSFRSQIHGKEAQGGKVLQFWRASTALAAGLALVFGGLLWREMSRDPRVLPEAQQLYADGQRGGSGEAVTLTGNDDVFVLIVPLYDPGAFERFRLEIVDVEPGARTLWRGDAQTRRSDDTFRIEVPRSYLDAGKYRVVLYGVDGTREQRLDTYTVRVRP